MPKSRGRRAPSRTTRRPRGHHHGDLLRHFPLVRAADEAEARGDALTALQIIVANPDPDGTGSLFWRPERVTRLHQLVTLRSVLPSWVTSRWILAQAAQWLDRRTTGGRQRALTTASGIRGIEAASPACDDFEALTHVMDHDWVYRQLVLYDEGGLVGFLQRGAAADLVAGADRILDWSRTPMGGFELLEETPTTLRWRDLATGAEVDALNLGAATLVGPGECVVGRLVPIEGGAMFETAPLFVPDDVAAAVARDPDEWLPKVAEACRRPVPPELRVRTSQEFRLLTDVPPFVQDMVTAAALEEDGDRDRVMRDGLMPWIVALVRAAAAGDPPVAVADCSPWPSVAAVLVEPLTVLHLHEHLAPAEVLGLLRLAERLPEPAASACAMLASLVDGNDPAGER